MTQESRIYDLKDLELWNDNPRIRIPMRVTNAKITDLVNINDFLKTWDLVRYFEKMKLSGQYDESESPTVVIVDDKPVVFDGNRRVLIGKIIHKHLLVNQHFNFHKSEFLFPPMIRCNVCDLKTAIRNIYRKHAPSGSWGQMERDLFVEKYKKYLTHLDKSSTEKKPWMVVDQAMDCEISNEPKLNQRFVRDEVLTIELLSKMGFSVSGNILLSRHSSKDSALAVLNTIFNQIKTEKLSTRKQRGEIENILKNDSLTKDIMKDIDANLRPSSTFSKSGPFVKSGNVIQNPSIKSVPITPIVDVCPHVIFGNEPLKLKRGYVNNLYLDLINLMLILNEKNIQVGRKKIKFSRCLNMIIRMSIRLICDVAAQQKFPNIKDPKDALDLYVKNSYEIANKNLSKDDKRFLSCLGMRDNATFNTILKLLHNGAHGHMESIYIDQTIALSILVGKMLVESHGKK